ncbi:MAG: hypothetical protein QM762_14400 [Chryseolinea sp.]
MIPKRIDDFQLTKQQEKIVKGQIEAVLHAVVDKADTIMHQKRKSVKAKLRQAIINALVNEKKIHQKVANLHKPSSVRSLKTKIKEKLKSFWGFLRFKNTAH